MTATALLVPNLIDGQRCEPSPAAYSDNLNPATQEKLSVVPLCGDTEVAAAVAAAKQAYPAWRETPPLERARVFFRLQALLREHMDELAELITREQGKTLEDARGDVTRGLEVVEYATGIPSLIMGETVENVARSIDTASYQQPLGVCAGITPFNFPAMIPLWMFPLALAAGNTFVLKPSEQAPMTAVRLAELAMEAGVPNGVLNVVHGGADAVNALCDHPDIRAVSFVGSAPTGKHVFARSTATGKRCQALLGAKNHATILPDANRDKALNCLLGAAFGASGQRCMAVSVAVFVGESRQWIPELLERAKTLKVGAGHEGGVDVGPLISPRAKERVCALIQSGVEEGAELLLDGRQVAVEGYEQGNFVGPTILRGATPEMEIYREEIFGPVLLCMEVESLDAAIALTNSNPYGNGCALFTESGQAARHYQRHIDVGQVGINIPIPVPLPFFSFSGWKGSLQGDHHAYGKHGLRFYTQTKTVTTRWLGDEATGAGTAVNTSIRLGE